MAETASLFSRRNMLLGAAGAAAVGGLATTQSFTGSGSSSDLRPAQAGRRGVPLASAEADDWALQIGTIFTAHTGHLLKLTSVQRFPVESRPAGLRQRAFAANFEITEGGALSSSEIYRFNHAEGGTLEMLLNGTIEGRPERIYAVFN